MASAWTVSAGSTTATFATGTTSAVATSSTNGTYVFQIDTTNMTGGDLFRVHILTNNATTTTTASLVQAWVGTWQNAQLNPHKISPMIPVIGNIQINFEVAAGSSLEVLPWQLLVI